MASENDFEIANKKIITNERGFFMTSEEILCVRISIFLFADSPMSAEKGIFFEGIRAVIVGN